MSDSQNSTSPQIQLIYEWGRGFQEKSVEILAKSLHDDFHHITHPRSLRRPEQNKEDWLKHLANVFPLWTDTESTHHSMIEAPGKVIYHFSQKTKTTLGVDLHYESLTIAQIVPDKDGNLKIKQIDEFIDSITYLDSMKAIETT